ncbi:hypothetical protein Emag_000520 [Eimeria magna]
MASLAEDAAAEHSRALKGLSLATQATTNLEGGAFAVKESSLAQRPRRVPKHRCLQALTVAIVASLAAVYMVLSCFRHISQLNSVGPQVRAVAEGGFEETACLGGPEEEPLEGAAGGAEETEGGAAGGDDQHIPAGAEGGIAEGESSEAEAGGTRAGGWGRRKMSSDWVARVCRYLLKLKDLANDYAAILPSLGPAHAIEVAQYVASWGSVEVGAFATAPEETQSARAQAGSAFVMLIENILSDKRLAPEVHRRRCRGHLEALQRLILSLTGVPPLKERVSRSTYRGSITGQWTLGTYSAAHVESLLELLQPENNPGGVPPELVQRSVAILQALYRARMHGLLGRHWVAFWFSECQARTARYLLYGPKEYQKVKSEGMKRLSEMLESLADAVREAGGVPRPIPLPPERTEGCPEIKAQQLFSQAQPILQTQAVSLPAVQPPAPPQAQARVPSQARPRLPTQPRARLAPRGRSRLPQETQPRVHPQLQAPPPPEVQALPHPQVQAPPPPQAAPLPSVQAPPPPPPHAPAFPFYVLQPLALPQIQAPLPPWTRPRLPVQPRARFAPRERSRLPLEAQPRPHPRDQAPPPPPPPPRAESLLLSQPQALSPPQVQAFPPPQAESLPFPSVEPHAPPQAEPLSASHVPARGLYQPETPFGPQERARPRQQLRGRFPRPAQRLLAPRAQGLPPPQGQPVPPPQIRSPPHPEAPLLFPRQLRPPHRRPHRPRAPSQFLRPPHRPFESAPIQMPTPPVPQVPYVGPLLPSPLSETIPPPVVFPPPAQPSLHVEAVSEPLPLQQFPPSFHPSHYVEFPQPMGPHQPSPQPPLLMPEPGLLPYHQAPPMGWAPVGQPAIPGEVYHMGPGDQLYYYPQGSYAMAPQGFYFVHPGDPYFMPPPDPQIMTQIETYPAPPQGHYPLPPHGPQPAQEQPPPPQPAAADAGTGDGEGEGELPVVEAQLSSLSVDDQAEGQ